MPKPKKVSSYRYKKDNGISGRNWVSGVSKFKDPYHGVRSSHSPDYVFMKDSPVRAKLPSGKMVVITKGQNGETVVH